MSYRMHVLAQKDYKPGDPAPSGYLAWHEWAEIQHKAGLRQVECGRCMKWKYPQELSGIVDKFTATDKRGKPVELMTVVCNECVAPSAGQAKPDVLTRTAKENHGH